MPSAYPAAIPRRILTVTISWLAFAAVVLLTPLLVVVSVATDLLLGRKGSPTCRMVAFVVVALWIEVSSHPPILWVWLTQPFARKSWTLRNNELMHWWVGRLTRGA